MLVDVSVEDNSSIFKLPSSEINRFFKTFNNYLSPLIVRVFKIIIKR